VNFLGASRALKDTLAAKLAVPKNTPTIMKDTKKGFSHINGIAKLGKEKRQERLWKSTNAIILVWIVE
jgi:hypothetical protein